MSFPSAKDPSAAARCPGGQTLEIVTLAPYEHFAAWEGTRWHHRGEAYDAVKRRIVARMFDALSEHLPAVVGAVKTWELSTPLSTEHFANSHTARSMDLRTRRPASNAESFGRARRFEGCI